jgi:hypothetical protein
LLSKARGYPIEKIVFPVGQDFFHMDSHKRDTFNDTGLESDSRYPKMFLVGCKACIAAIDQMRLIAPVDVLWVPGNHDRTASWHLAAYLSAWYSRCDNVTVDVSPTTRKYIRYGVNLIGYTHGDEEKHDSLPAIMAAEAGKDWANTSYREWHVGHWHKRKEVRYTAMDSHVGIPVRFLPSLSGTDFWHYAKGYINKQRAAEAYLWSKTNGYSGHFSSNIQSEKIRTKDAKSKKK